VLEISSSLILFFFPKGKKMEIMSKKRTHLLAVIRSALISDMPIQITAIASIEISNIAIPLMSVSILYLSQIPNIFLPP
jgi:hypothetical protein